MPIIALTADVRPEVRRSCIDAGMNGFLSKPIRLVELGAVLGEHLQAETINSAVDETNRSSTANPPPETAHGLDEDIVEAIHEHGDDHATAHEVAMMFSDMWRNIPTGLERIELARSNGDVTDGQAQCHRVRGVLANYGFQRAADLLGEMETDAAVFNRAASMAAVRGLLQAGHQELMRRYDYLGKVAN